jgi:hypothetical protein
MSKPSLISRKEIAALLGESCRTVVRNETRLGIDTCRADINQHLVRYNRTRAIRALIDRGFLSEVP